MGLTLAAGQGTGAVACPALPEPEQVFVAWLVKQPSGANLVDAAQRELARLAQYRGDHPGPGLLRRMFIELIAELEAGHTDGKAMPS